MYNQKDNNLEGVLASLSPECVDQLCSIIIAKLTGMNPPALASQANVHFTLTPHSDFRFSSFLFSISKYSTHLN